uniref:Sulfide:quinone oxidoreductase, mitochondrial n=1 Tax=Strongyloides stercoralis TaxID=6248 RepID=A0A0K0ENX4_STRER
MHFSRRILGGQHFKLVVLGGGSGGLSISSYFSRKLPKGSIAVIEPNKSHYYQPGFTLVGGGLKELDVLKKDQKSLMPPNVTWIQDRAGDVIPSQNKIETLKSGTINYDFLVIATGCQIRYDKIEGAKEGLESDQSIVSIYHPNYAVKTFQKMKEFDGGNALFTYPNTPIKCAGAPQKICYLFEDYQRKHGKLPGTVVMYNTTLGKIFGVEKYAEALMKHVHERNIVLHTRRNLTKVDPLTNVATFELLDNDGKSTGQFVEEKFNYLHIGAPCSPVDVMLQSAKSNEKLVDENGWVDVDKYTLQSKNYFNVFGVGDAVNCPNAKTAAAISTQCKVLKDNIVSAMNGKKLEASYNGYGSCPLVISYGKGILAEFNYNGPIETLPIDQSKPSYFNYALKVHLMPPLYWNGLVKGIWDGPCQIRKLFHLGMCKD